MLEFFLFMPLNSNLITIFHTLSSGNNVCRYIFIPKVSVCSNLKDLVFLRWVYKVLLLLQINKQFKNPLGLSIKCIITKLKENSLLPRVHGKLTL